MAGNEQIKSQVSSFMDGEIEKDEVSLLCKRMANDQELREQWRDYHLIRDVLTQQLPEQSNVDLSARIQDALSDEPAFSAKTKTASTGLVKRLSGLAVAASVAILGVVVVLNTAVQPNGGEATMLASTPPVSNTVVTQVAEVSSGSVSADRPMDPRLNKYLVDHSEYAVSASVHGILPYARIVGHPPVRK